MDLERLSSSNNRAGLSSLSKLENPARTPIIRTSKWRAKPADIAQVATTHDITNEMTAGVGTSEMLL
jgi:hypothetical protein